MFGSHHGIDMMKSYENSYGVNCHASSIYPPYGDNQSATSSTSQILIKTETQPEQMIHSNFSENMRSSPTESSDRSEVDFNSLSKQSKGENLNGLPDNLAASEHDQGIENIYQAGKDELISSNFPSFLFSIWLITLI